MKRKFTKFEKVSILLLILGVFAVLFVPEVRHLLGLKGPEPQKQTGNATTTGPNSPAVTGDDNKIEYSQPPPPKEEKPEPPKEKPKQPK